MGRGELCALQLNRLCETLAHSRTGDITSDQSRTPCCCGRTRLRLERITGRTDDMPKAKVVNFYPKQIESLLYTIGRWAATARS